MIEMSAEGSRISSQRAVVIACFPTLCCGSRWVTRSLLGHCSDSEYPVVYSAGGPTELAQLAGQRCVVLLQDGPYSLSLLRGLGLLFAHVYPNLDVVRAWPEDLVHAFTGVASPGELAERLEGEVCAHRRELVPGETLDSVLPEVLSAVEKVLVASDAASGPDFC